MKKVLALIFLVALSASVYTSCKKGPQDPFLSFKSRESRMVGTWKVSAYTVDGTDSLPTNRATFTAAADPTCGDATYSASRTRSFTLTLGNDGNYSWINYLTFDTTVSWSKSTAAPKCKFATVKQFSDSVTSVIKGIWEFAGGVGKYNNKELLELAESTDDAQALNFEIVECSSKQLILRQALTLPTGPHVYVWTFKH